MSKIKLNFIKYLLIGILTVIFFNSFQSIAFPIDLFYLSESKRSWFEQIQPNNVKYKQFYEDLQSKYKAKYINEGISEALATQKAEAKVAGIESNANRIYQAHVNQGSLDSAVVTDFKDDVLPFVTNDEEKITSQLFAFDLRKYDGIAFGFERSTNRTINRLNITNDLLIFSNKKNYFTVSNFETQIEGASIPHELFLERNFNPELVDKLIDFAIKNNKQIAFRLDLVDFKILKDQYADFIRGDRDMAATSQELFTILKNEDAFKATAFFEVDRPIPAAKFDDIIKFRKQMKDEYARYLISENKLPPLPPKEKKKSTTVTCDI